jgi:1-aminocyclopropane-1-carboxylate deaminase/D-cysteine desulfhydrase-like pyridoxal-dependent ACC family enzyme
VSVSIPLFSAYPGLKDALPYMPLGNLPTPIDRLYELESVLHGGSLYVKRDDLSGHIYGGNKVRKLEFLLGRACASARKAVLTFGCAGSNHALATAIYARQAGLDAISILLPQPNARTVRRNLMAGWHAGADLHHYLDGKSAALGTLHQLRRRRLSDGRYPEVIAPGGSSPLGALGFVNAAFELKAQIGVGEMPEPDLIYVASGTMGTVVGLTLGLEAAGLKSRIVAVRVTSPPYTSLEKAHRLFDKTNALLQKADPSFPILTFPEQRFCLRDEFLGERYALYTKDSVQAKKQVNDTEGLNLEGTYTGKAMACLLADAAKGALQDKTVLFWNTYNSQPFDTAMDTLDYHALPEAFHHYFEEDVQPLDQ